MTTATFTTSLIDCLIYATMNHGNPHHNEINSDQWNLLVWSLSLPPVCAFFVNDITGLTRFKFLNRTKRTITQLINLRVLSFYNHVDHVDWCWNQPHHSTFCRADCQGRSAIVSKKERPQSFVESTMHSSLVTSGSPKQDHPQSWQTCSWNCNP